MKKVRTVNYAALLVTLIIAGARAHTAGGQAPPLRPDAPRPRWVNISPRWVSTNPNKPSFNFGFQAIAIDPHAPTTLYVGTCYQGLWKTKDGGRSWYRANTGTNGDVLNGGRLWSLAIDRFSPSTLYAANGYGSWDGRSDAQGIWKSTDGGTDWQQMLPPTSTVAQRTSLDVYEVVTDPYRSGHILVAFHSDWAGLGHPHPSGLLESTDGGATWIVHQAPRGWAGGNRYVFFLNNSATWLVGTQDAGYWRTADSGKSWHQVSRVGRQDGGGGIYRARNGVWYVGALTGLLRSADDGQTWIVVGPRPGADGYYTVIGDGRHLYAQTANGGFNTSGPNYYVWSPESDGVHWARYNDQLFRDGPMSMAYDPINHVIYSSNWDAGLWKLQTGR